MSKMLKISADLQLVIDALMQPIGLLGNRGCGKSYAGMKLFELAYEAGVQCIAVDGIGKWWGLRLAADGKGPGLERVYIFGGKRADFPITPDRGAFVARVLVSHRIHAILDVSQMRKAERRRFLTDFAEEFHLLKKQEDQPTPSVMFLEEAHQVLPQKPFGEEARMLGAFEDLIREGRNAGIGMVIMDQRPATVNKNALALIEILIALRTTYEIDRKVYTGWVVQKVADNKLRIDLEQQLPFLKAGEGFIYAPLYDLFERIKILPKRTFDSSATAKIGVKAAELGTLTPVDVERVKDAMAEVTAEVASKDPVALRRQVAELQKQLAAKMPTATKAEPVEVPVSIKKELEMLDRAITKIDEIRDRLAQQQQVVVAALDNARTILAPTRPAPTRTPVPNPPAGSHPIRIRQIDPQQPPAGPKSGEGPTPYARQLLETIASRQPMRPTRSQISVLSGRSPRSSAFSGAMAEITREGWASEDHGQFNITDTGLAQIGGTVPVPVDGIDIRSTWLRALPGYESALLKALLDSHPDGLTRAALADTTGKSLTSSAFSGAISTLKKNQLVEDRSGGLFASDTLFPAEAA